MPYLMDFSLRMVIWLKSRVHLIKLEQKATNAQISEIASLTLA